MGCEQIVDITDDGTGEPHEDARKLSAIYVNEVGHNTSLMKNVDISQFGGIVSYHIDIQQSMKRGDEVELLCDYQSHYEATRERKGYGLENLLGKQKSDYDVASKLARNFTERRGIEEMIEAMSLRELFYNMEFVALNVLPVVDKALQLMSKDSISPISSQVASPLQLLAKRRMHWLATVYLKRIDAIKGARLMGANNILVASSERVVAEMRAKCLEWAELMKWTNLLDYSRMDIILEPNLKVVFEAETVEEVLYSVREHVQYPMDVNLWCPIARDLMSQLCKVTFEHKLQFGAEGHKATLAKAFLDCASKSAAFVRKAITESAYENLVFCSGAEGKWRVKGSRKNLVTLAAGSALSSSTILKGAVSSLMDIQAYQDMVDLGLVSSMGKGMVMERTCDDPVVVAFTTLGGAPLDGMPRRVDFVRQHNGTINEMWYLIWQIVYPVHSIFVGLFEETSSTIPITGKRDDEFLHELCHALKVDYYQARLAINTGIRDDLAAPQLIFTSRASLEEPKRRGPGMTSKHHKPSNKVRAVRVQKVAKPKVKREAGGGICSKVLFFDIVWKALTGLGWTLLVGNRPTDYYFLPPGVKRGREFGFKPRVDFFDSYKQVLAFLQSDPRWKDKDEIKECLFMFTGSAELLRGKRVKGELKLESILEQVKENRISNNNNNNLL